jgi:hypothetical protein
MLKSQEDTMSINGINFKVSTVGKGQSADPADEGIQNQNDQIEDYFENAFGETSGSQGTSGSTGSSSSNPLDSYTAGHIENGQVTSDPYTNSADRLINFPPSLEEVVAGNPSAIEYLDLLASRYETAEDSLRELIENYRQTLPTVTASEAADLQLRMDAATQAIVRCKAVGEQIKSLDEQQGGIYLKEVGDMKDYNNDNWIGRPNFKGSYYLKYNDDGSVTYMDPITKRAVINPLMDPVYQAQFTNNDNLEIISAEDSIMAQNDGYDAAVDLTLRLTEQALANGQGKFGCPIDIGIPEYVWVKRDPDAEGAYKWESNFEGTASADKISIYDEWEEGPNGIQQKIPENLSDYIQVQITGVNVDSEPSGYFDSSDEEQPLYNHVIEFTNATDVVTRIVIEGFNTSSAYPCATPIDDGDNYVAASSVGLSLHGEKRANPIEIDASGLISTGRHLTADLESQLGISAPADARGERAYKENIEAFTQESHKTEYFDGTDWQEKNHDWSSGDYGYSDSCKDRYMSSSEVPTENDTLLAFKTGVFISGVRGNITGTRFNDVIVTDGVNEYSDYALEHLPADRLDIMKEDPFYSNCVNSDGGSDVVICGSGDNYVIGATFVDIRNSNNCDSNYIATPGVYDGQAKGSKGRTNSKCYINVTGGDDTYIFNPNEYDPTAKSESETETEAWEDAWEDDYYKVGRGSQTYTMPGDDDIVGGAASEDTITSADIKDLAGTAMDEFYTELTKVPELDEEAMAASWDDILGAKHDLDVEMDDFFNQMFGGFEGLFSDLSVDTAL